MPEVSLKECRLANSNLCLGMNLRLEAMYLFKVLGGKIHLHLILRQYFLLLNLGKK